MNRTELTPAPRLLRHRPVRPAAEPIAGAGDSPDTPMSRMGGDSDVIPWTPRRVLMTADTVGGVWTYALDLATALSRRGIEVVMATMGRPLDQVQRAAAERLEIRIHASSWRLEWMPNAWADVDRAGDWLEELAAVEQPDLIHFNNYCHAARGWNAPIVVVGHSCVWSWWRAVHGEDPPDEWREYRRQVRAGLLAADRVVAPTRAMLTALERAYGPLPHGRVVRNGRARGSHDGFGARMPHADRAIDPANKFPFVMSAGRLWDEAKNLATLDRAAADIRWPIAVAGEARHPDGSFATADHVTLLGKLSPPDMAAWLERAAIYAAPARYEPFGLSVLEAGLAGCALVVGDIDSLREVWGSAACYVPPDDPAALSEAVTRLIHDPARRHVLSRAARARALSFDAGHMAEGYLNVYREAVSVAGRANRGAVS